MEKQIFGREKKNKKWWLVEKKTNIGCGKKWGLEKQIFGREKKQKMVVGWKKKQILGVEKNGGWKNKY